MSKHECNAYCCGNLHAAVALSNAAMTEEAWMSEPWRSGLHDDPGVVVRLVSVRPAPEMPPPSVLAQMHDWPWPVDDAMYPKAWLLIYDTANIVRMPARMCD